MVKAGMVDTRTGKPSLNAWKRESGVHTSTISKFIQGANTRTSNVRKLADALGVPVGEVFEMAGRSQPDLWEPPAVSESLTQRQRAALNELILAFTSADQEARHEQEPGQGTQKQKQRCQSSAEDGGEAERGTPPIDEGDWNTFGTPRPSGDLGDGELDTANVLDGDELAQRRRSIHEQYPDPVTPAAPEREDSAAYEPEHKSKGVESSEEASRLGEEGQE